MTDGIRIQLFKVRSFSLKIARKLYSELQNLYSLDSDSIRQHRRARPGPAGPDARDGRPPRPARNNAWNPDPTL